MTNVVTVVRAIIHIWTFSFHTNPEDRLQCELATPPKPVNRAKEKLLM